MKLGINQLALLRRCLLRGSIGLGDVGVYYHFKDSRRRFAVLEKLELQGCLTQSEMKRHMWLLTDKGKQFLNEYLQDRRDG